MQMLEWSDQHACRRVDVLRDGDAHSAGLLAGLEHLFAGDCNRR